MLNDTKKYPLVSLKLCGLPGVVGSLDETNLKLSSALNGERNSYNRKEDLSN